MRVCGISLLLLLLLGHSLSVPCPPCVCYLRDGELTARCSRMNLMRIPDTIPPNVNHLLLNVNNINETNKTLQSFKDLITLDWSSNHIDTLNIDSFAHNKKLKTLNLRNNDLRTESFPKGVFRSQKALTKLSIAQNPMSDYPDTALSDLVSLSNLVVDGHHTPAFGKGFADLKVRSLDMSGHKRRCEAKHLTNSSFTNMKYLFYLDVSECVITQIDAGAFLPLQHIDTLDMSHNKYLGYDSFGQSIFGLRHSSIRVLKANRIVSEFSIGKALSANHAKHIIDTNLKEISFDFNRLEIVDSNAFYYLSKVESMSVNGNRFVAGPYFLAGDGLRNIKRIQACNQYASTAFDFYSRQRFNTIERRSIFRNVEDKERNQYTRGQFGRLESHLEQKRDTGDGQINIQLMNKSDIAFVREEYDMFDREKELNVFSSKLRGEIVRIPFPKNLEMINISNSRLDYVIGEITFYNNSLRVLDLSGNVFTNWSGPVKSVTGHLVLEYLDLSDNFCRYISPTFFHTTPHLRTLNINKNYLSVYLAKDVKGLIFKRSTKLRTLRISHNILQDLPQGLFGELRELEHLDLSWNSLSSWTLGISHMVHLHHLDISFNRFYEIPSSLRADIDHIMKHNKSVLISVRGNSLRCDCQTLGSLHWMLDSKVTFPELNATQCQLEDKSSVHLGNLQRLVNELQLRCTSTASLVVGLSLGVLVCLLLSVAGVVYRYRWKLRYLYYTTRRRHRGYQRLDQEQDNFKYDAFISYSDEDRHFVIDDMRAILENRFGLKLCIHHRDFMVGQAITDNIINAIQTSRKTVVVLSPTLLKSSWCLYEVHMARLEGVYTGRDVVCVVWYRDPPSNKGLPSDLLEELATGTYLKYKQEGEEGGEMFWQSLRDALTGARD